MKTFIIVAALAASCGQVPTQEQLAAEPTPAATASAQPEQKRLPMPEVMTTSAFETEAEVPTKAMKLSAENCVDPDLSKVLVGTQFMKCDGTMAEGTMVVAAPTATPTAAPTASPIPSCSDNGQIGCVTTAEFRPIANYQNLQMNNIREGVAIGYLVGNLHPYPQCNGTYTTGCAANDNYKAVASNVLVAGNIRSGVTMAGIVGTAAIPEPKDVRAGVQAAGGLGTLKIGCTNSSMYGTVDPSWATTVDGGRYSGNNDYRINEQCNGMEEIDIYGNFRDHYAGLQVHIPNTSIPWPNAVNYCDQLDINGVNDWRMASQKELMQLYIDGSRDMFGISAVRLWSATSASSGPADSSYAWSVHPTFGQTESRNKNESNKFACVRNF